MTQDLSRRLALKKLVRGVSFLSTSPTCFAALSSPLSTIPDNDAYWEMVRQQFPFREDKVPMNAANLCPSPRQVAEKVVELTQDIDEDCSFNNRAKFKSTLEHSRYQVANQLGVTGDEIALVRNTSEANNIINNGFPLKPGDEIVFGIKTIQPTMLLGIYAHLASTPGSNESRLLQNLPDLIN